MIFDYQPNVNLDGAIIEAVESWNYDCISWLIDRGAKPLPHLMLDKDHNLLESIMMSSCTKIRQLLVDAGAQVRNIPFGEKSPFDQGWYGLYYRQYDASPEALMEWLAANRRKINLHDKRVLQFAARAEFLDIAKELMVKGATCHADEKGYSPLDDFIHPVRGKESVTDLMRSELLGMQKNLEELEGSSVLNVILDRYKQVPYELREKILQYVQPYKKSFCPILDREIKRRFLVRLLRRQHAQHTARIVGSITKKPTLIDAGSADVDIDKTSQEGNDSISRATGYNNPFVAQLLLDSKSDSESAS